MSEFNAEFNLNPSLEDEYKKDIEYILEANSFESFSLWKQDNVFNHYRSGCGVNVGNIDNDPNKRVWISIGVSSYEGLKFLEWYATSRFVDYNMIDAWFKLHFKDIPTTDANNFHHITNAARRKLEGK